MQNNDGVYEIDLLRLFLLFWQKLWIIILAALLCGGCAFAYARFLIAPTYEASTYFYVNNNSISVGSTKVSLTSSDLNASQSLVDTYIVILKTRNSIETIKQRANVDYSYKKMSEMISASAVNSTEIFKVTVTSTSAKEAYEIANAVAAVLPDKINEIVSGTSAKVVDYPVIDNNKVAPSVTKYTAIGTLIGIMLSCLVIFLVDMFNDDIENESYILDNIDIPVLAVIPDLKANGSSYYYYGHYDDAQAGGKEKK